MHSHQTSDEAVWSGLGTPFSWLCGVTATVGSVATAAAAVLNSDFPSAVRCCQPSPEVLSLRTSRKAA